MKLAFLLAPSLVTVAFVAAAATTHPSPPPSAKASDAGTSQAPLAPGDSSGPLVLRAALQSFGIAVSDYEALVRECNVTETGTSIDDLEVIANRRGLQAEQAIAPPEDLLEGAGYLPAIIVVNSTTGPDFRLLKKVEKARAQVLNPRVGDRWVPIDELQRSLYLHEQVIAAAQWRAYARSTQETERLARRLSTLAGSDGTQLLARALADGSDGPLQRLDAAARAAGPRHEGKAALLQYWQDESRIPPDAWFARTAGTGLVRLRGTVFVTLRGRASYPARP